MLKFAVLIICALLFCNTLKAVKSPIHVWFVLAVSIGILFFVITQFGDIVSFISELADKAKIDEYYISIIVKAIGICYLGDITAALCKDSGENALAYNAELLSKCSIVVLTIPIYRDILNVILKIWESI